MDIDDQFKLLSKEVQLLIFKLRNENKKNHTFNSYFKGVQILFSALHYKPKILLLGINPGSGYFDYHNHNVVKKYKPLTYHEYFTKDNIVLGSEFRKIFARIGKITILENSVKTNFYYFATSNVKELKKMKNSLPVSLKNEFEKNANLWTRKMIQMISPKIIICEGYGAYNCLLNSGIFVIKNERSGVVWKSCEIGNTKVIACKRFRSIIIGKNLFASRLNKTIENDSFTESS